MGGLSDSTETLARAFSESELLIFLFLSSRESPKSTNLYAAYSCSDPKLSIATVCAHCAVNMYLSIYVSR